MLDLIHCEYSFTGINGPNPSVHRPTGLVRRSLFLYVSNYSAFSSFLLIFQRLIFQHFDLKQHLRSFLLLAIQKPPQSLVLEAYFENFRRFQDLTDFSQYNPVKCFNALLMLETNIGDEALVTRLFVTNDW